MLPHSILTLLRKVKVKASPKSKTRPGRASLRSLISIQAFRDDRYILRRIAVLWRNTTPLVEYYPLSNHLLPSNDEATGIGVIASPHPQVQAQTHTPSIRRITPIFSDPITAVIDKRVSQYQYHPRVASEEKALISSFCIPTILITPPSDNDDDASSWFACNVIPMPQNSADGVYLTVPGVVYPYTASDWCAHKEQRFATSQNLERCSVFGDLATPSQGVAEVELGIKGLVRSYACFQEAMDADDADDGIDLGPTWSG